MGGSLPGYPFVVPSIHVSSAASSPLGLAVPAFSGATATTTEVKSRFSKLYTSSPSENESSPPPTELAEQKARAQTKIDEKEIMDNATGPKAGKKSSPPATLRKVRHRSGNERSAEEIETLRQRRLTISFSRISSFLGRESTQL
jgi:hypothetical protein